MKRRPPSNGRNASMQPMRLPRSLLRFAPLVACVGWLGAGCQNGTSGPLAAGDVQSARGALTAGAGASVAAQEQAKADFYTQQVALHRGMADKDRQVAAAFAAIVSKETTAGASTAVAASKQADRLNAATLADQLAANAQSAAAFYLAKVSEFTDHPDGGGGQ
jgi:hypothetical protein